MGVGDHVGGGRDAEEREDQVGQGAAGGHLTRCVLVHQPRDGGILVQRLGTGRARGQGEHEGGREDGDERGATAGARVAVDHFRVTFRWGPDGPRTGPLTRAVPA